jgi:hypothetical protein
MGDLTVARHTVTIPIGVNDQRHVVGPECVPRKGGQRFQHGDRSRRIGRHLHYPSIAGDPNESHFGDGCRGPAPRGRAGKPMPRRCVMDVVGPTQCDQHIDVQQGRHPSSSRPRATSADVIRGASGGTSKAGSPSTSTIPTGLSDRRASSEITEPTDRCSARAMLRASSRTSSSICNVVRMTSGYQRARVVHISHSTHCRRRRPAIPT